MGEDLVALFRFIIALQLADTRGLFLFDSYNFSELVF